MKQSILMLFATLALTACNTTGREDQKNDNIELGVVSKPEINSSSMSPDGDSDPGFIDPATAAIPAEQHRQLAASEGRWRTEMTYWTSPEATPITVRGTCDIRMLLGGRYQQSVYKSETNGVPFEGIGYIAYDNARKMYISTWIDNTGTGIVYLEGGYDGSAATTEMIGQCTEVASCRQRGMRQVTTNVDKNTQIMEMYQTPEGGDEYKSMQVRFTRINSGEARRDDLVAFR